MDGQHVIGVDLGGTKILAGVVDRDGRVERRREYPTPLTSEDDLITGLDQAVDELLDDAVVAVGFGPPVPDRPAHGPGAAGGEHPARLDVDFRARM